MTRILIVVLLLFAAVAGLDWAGTLPVAVSVSWPGGEMTPPFRLILVAVIVLVIVTIVIWSVLRGVFGTPKRLVLWSRARRQRRGQETVTRGLIAAAAGDTRLVQREVATARKLIGDHPLVLLLQAEAASLDGKTDAVRLAYEDMAAKPETRLLGLRGLYLESRRLDAPEAARHYASEAMALSPGIAWASSALIEFQSADGDWKGALASLDLAERGHNLDKAAVMRLRAVLLTAHALQIELAEPENARKAALSAHKLAPGLVPAAVLGARLHARGQDYRRATKVLETTWKIEPHPELAEAYIHVRPGDSPRDRMKRARQLAQIRSHNPEGTLAVARAALDAADFAEARNSLQQALRQSPTQRVFLEMARLEELESNDTDRIRDWLSRAVHAPRDPAWTADGIVSDHWMPASPVTRRLDAFEWRVPVTDRPAVIYDAETLITLAAPKASETPVISAADADKGVPARRKSDVGTIADAARKATASN